VRSRVSGSSSRCAGASLPVSCHITVS
jgi:hypothetical protein